MSADKFWYEWLRITMIIVILCGLLMVIVGNVIPCDYLDRIVYSYFIANRNPELEVLFHKDWLFSVCGALTAGWGISMLYIMKHTFIQKTKWAWYSIFYPVIIWYILDSTISLYFGVYFSVLLNSILLLQILAPLLFLRNQFFNKMISIP